ncbi:MAG: disulfide bond formation protein B [Burkholderiaceae bacterium]
MNPLAASARMLYASIGVISFALIAIALVLQHAVGLAPCPLCIFQRIAYFAVGFLAITAAALTPRSSARVLGVFVLLSTLAGAGIAGRHVWLQMNPQGLSCGPGLATMLENFPLTDVLPKVFRGSGDCSEASWTLLGLTIADWSLLWFVILSAMTIVALFAPRFRPRFAR